MLPQDFYKIWIISIIVITDVVSAVWQQKSDIISNQQVDSTSNLNDQSSAKIVGDDVQDTYKGAGGSSLIKNNQGTVKADQAGQGNSFDAIGPGGQTEQGTINKGQKSGTLKDHKGNKVDVQGGDANNENALVNNKDRSALGMIEGSLK